MKVHMAKKASLLLWMYIAPSAAFVPYFKPPNTAIPRKEIPVIPITIANKPFSLYINANEDPDSDDESMRSSPPSGTSAISAVLPVLTEGLEEQFQQQQKQLKEINLLTQQMKQKETSITRLKFQLNALKTAAQESETKWIEAEEKVKFLKKQSEDVRKKNVAEYDKIQGQLRKEREETERKLRSSANELNKVKADSQKQFDDAVQKAEDEKMVMMSEITTLRQELDKTNQMIIMAKREIYEIANNSALELDQKMKEIAARDEQIQGLTAIRNQYENKINLLEAELETLQVALKESKKEIELIQLEASDEKEKLESQILQLKSELTYATDKIERATKSVYEVRQAADAKVNKIQKEANSFKSKMRQLLTQETSHLKERVEDLEFKMTKANYDVIVAEKEAKRLKAAALKHESEIKALEQSYQKQMFDVEQNLMAKEMYFARSKAESRRKSQSLVSRFRNKLERKEKKVVDAMETLRQQILSAFDMKNTLVSGKQLSVGEQTAELTITLSDAVAKMNARNQDFETKILLLEKSLSDIKERAQKDLQSKEEEYNMTLENERERAAAEKYELISEQKKDIQKLEEEKRRDISVVRMEMKQKLNDYKDENKRLKFRLKEQDQLIQNYEEEHQSYRKLIKLLWKATREKVSFRRKK